jgi:hypothetical protein
VVAFDNANLGAVQQKEYCNYCIAMFHCYFSYVYTIVTLLNCDAAMPELWSGRHISKRFGDLVARRCPISGHDQGPRGATSMPPIWCRAVSFLRVPKETAGPALFHPHGG